MASDAILNLARLPVAPPPIPKAKIMSVSGYEPGSIKARMEALKKHGKDRRDAVLAKLDGAIKKDGAVSDQIEGMADAIEKEIDAAAAEFAEFSNGGPL